MIGMGANPNKVAASNKMWSERFENEEAYAAWCDKHIRGVQAFHNDAVKRAAWRDKHTRGVQAFHNDA